METYTYGFSLTRVGSAKAVTADILDGVTKGAGKEYAVLYNVAYNDKKSYIDVPLGEVRFNVTVYSAKFVSFPGFDFRFLENMNYQ